MRPMIALRLLVVATALAVATGAPTAVLGVFTAARSVASNSFSSGGCMLPRVSDVQRGTATSTADGTLSVAITAVDPTRAFLLFSTRHANNRPVGSMLRGQLVSATAVNFTRVTDEVSPTPITIEWSVVEYECGVLVQRGETTMTTATVDVTLAEVPANRSFVLFSKTVYAAAGAFGADETQVAEVTGPTTLQLRTPATGGIVAWQVVAFTEAGAAAVQRGSTSLGSADTAVTVPITAVDPSRAFVLASHQSSTASGADMGARMVRVELTSSTSLAVSRSTVGSSRPIDEVHWQVVELLDGSQVQSGVVAQAAGVASNDVTLPRAVDLRRATALGSVQHGSGQNAGRGSYVTDDTPGEMSFTLQLTDASTLRVTRASAVDEASIAWSVIEWGRAHTSPTCGLPRVRDVQRGVVDTSAAGTTTVPIEGVDTTRAFLTFTSSSRGDRPTDSFVRGELSSRELNFRRPSYVNASIEIRWTVVEYECGVRVQRGTTSQSGTVKNVSISPVAALDQAFVVFSKTSASTHSRWGWDDPIVVDLADPSTLQIRVNNGGSGHDVHWQVVEFTTPGAISVQRGATAMDTVTTSVTIPLGRAVDQNTTFVLASMSTSVENNEIGAHLVRARLTDPQTLVIERSTAGSAVALSEIAWQVIELRDGSTVRTGVETFAVSENSRTVTLPAIDLRRAVALATVQYGGGQNGGQTTYVGNDIAGDGSWAAQFPSATQLTLSRRYSGGTATVQWQVIEWGVA